MMNNPYIGPRTFSAKQGHLFFGREREARDLLSLVLGERLVLFHATSGAGKSSLIQTRLRPQLAKERFNVSLPVGRVSGELPHGITAVSNNFTFNLILSLDENRQPAHELTELTLSDYLRQRMTPDVNTPFVLIIDQFEEILNTNLQHWAQRRPFFEQLQQAMSDQAQLWVVLAMREDYVAALEPFSHVLPNRLRTRYGMQRLGYKAALQAVSKPVEKLRPFAKGVAEQLVDNLRQIKLQGFGDSQTVLGEFVEPVQLQVVCFRLWESLVPSPLAPLPGGEGNNETLTPTPLPKGEGLLDTSLSPWERAGVREITADDLAQLGDVDQTLGDFYEEVLRGVLGVESARPRAGSDPRGRGSLLSVAELARPRANRVTEERLRGWFNEQLITAAETRGQVYQNDKTGETAGIPNGLVKQLQDKFILRAEVRAGGTWLELVHDRLVQPILKANREWRYKQQQIQRQRLVSMSVGLGLLLVMALNSYFYYTQRADYLAAQCEADFNNTASDAATRLNSLAKLQALGGEYEPRAVELISNLSLDEQAKLFEADNPVVKVKLSAAYRDNITAGRNRVQNLAYLFNLPGSEADALQLFDGLSAEERLALFTKNEATLLPYRKKIAEQSYTRTQNIDSRLLKAIQSTFELEKVSTEIAFWARARKYQDEAKACWARRVTGKGLREQEQKCQNEVNEAKRFYDLAIDLNPANPATRLERVAVMAYTGDYEAAVVDLTWVMQHHSEQQATVISLTLLSPQVYSLALISTFALSLPQLNSLVMTDMVTIPAGVFTMGSDNDKSEENEKPVHQVTLKAYQLDRYEVTNYQYGLCVVAGKCEPPRNSSSYQRTFYYGNAAYNNYPVINIDWMQAKSYCEWRGTRLPTEAEWEKAARGTDGRTYPWGEPIDDSYLNYDYRVGDTTQVGRYSSGASPYGVMDIAGNVWEWTSTDYKEYPYKPDDGREGNDIKSNNYKILRGAGWGSNYSNARVTSRFYFDTTKSYLFLGVRCVR